MAQQKSRTKWQPPILLGGRRYSGGGINRTSVKNDFRRVYSARQEAVNRDRPLNKRADDLHECEEDEREDVGKNHGRPLHKVGLFRNSKVSDLVTTTEALSDVVRERVDAKIRRLVRPEHDVEWTYNNYYDKYRDRERGAEYSYDSDCDIRQPNRKTSSRKFDRLRERGQSNTIKHVDRVGIRRFSNPHGDPYQNSGYAPRMDQPRSQLRDDYVGFGRRDSGQRTSSTEKHRDNPRNKKVVHVVDDTDSDDAEYYARPRRRNRVSPRFSDCFDRSDCGYEPERPRQRQKIRENLDLQNSGNVHAISDNRAQFSLKYSQNTKLLNDSQGGRRDRSDGFSNESMQAFVTPQPRVNTKGDKTATKQKEQRNVKTVYQAEVADDDWQQAQKWCESRATSYTTMVDRMNASLPALYLQDNTDMSYSRAALNLLAKSMKSRTIFGSKKYNVSSDVNSHRSQEVDSTQNGQSLLGESGQDQTQVMHELINKTTEWREKGTDRRNETISPGCARARIISEVSKQVNEDRLLENTVFCFSNENPFSAAADTHQSFRVSDEFEKQFDRTLCELACRKLDATLRKHAKNTQDREAHSKKKSESTGVRQSRKTRETEEFVFDHDKLSEPLLTPMRNSRNKETSVVPMHRIVVDSSDDDIGPNVPAGNDNGWQGGGGASQLGSFVYTPEVSSGGPPSQGSRWRQQVFSPVSGHNEVSVNHDVASKMPNQSFRIKYPGSRKQMPLSIDPIKSPSKMLVATPQMDRGDGGGAGFRKNVSPDVSDIAKFMATRDDRRLEEQTGDANRKARKERRRRRKEKSYQMLPNEEFLHDVIIANRDNSEARHAEFNRMLVSSQAPQSTSSGLDSYSTYRMVSSNVSSEPRTSLNFAYPHTSAPYQYPISRQQSQTVHSHSSNMARSNRVRHRIPSRHDNNIDPRSMYR